MRHSVSYRRIEIEGERGGRHRQADSRQSEGKLLRGAEREMPADTERAVKCQLTTHVMKHTNRGREETALRARTAGNENTGPGFVCERVCKC